MAKKYYQDRKDREDESRGMKKHEEKRDRRSFVTGHDPEIGRDSHAGLPEDKVMAAYPANRSRRGGYLDDSMSGIDEVQMDSDRQVERHMSNQK